MILRAETRVEWVYFCNLVQYVCPGCHVLITSSLLHNHSGWYGDHAGGKTKGIQTDFGSLASFWPGMQTLIGDLERAERTMHVVFKETWGTYQCMPERYNWQSHRISGDGYSLRPEFIESLYYLYRATGDNIWYGIWSSLHRSTIFLHFI